MRRLGGDNGRLDRSVATSLPDTPRPQCHVRQGQRVQSHGSGRPCPSRRRGRRNAREREIEVWESLRGRWCGATMARKAGVGTIHRRIRARPSSRSNPASTVPKLASRVDAGCLDRPVRQPQHPWISTRRRWRVCDISSHDGRHPPVGPTDPHTSRIHRPCSTGWCGARSTAGTPGSTGLFFPFERTSNPLSNRDRVRFHRRNRPRIVPTARRHAADADACASWCIARTEEGKEKICLRRRRKVVPCGAAWRKD